MKSINSLLSNDNSLLEHYAKAAKQLQYLTEILQRYLPGALKPYCQAANYRNNTLIIKTDSAAWATQLRYIIPDLLLQLKNHPEFKNVKTITWFINTPSAVPKTEPRFNNKISPENLSLLNELKKMLVK